MSHFLIQQAAKAIAGSAAPRVAAQIAQRLAAPTTRGEDRRRFLIWLAGPFRQSQPEAYGELWPRLHSNDETIYALTTVFLELQNAGPGAATTDWFVQLAASDQRHFDELVTALMPKQADTQQRIKQASQDAEASLRGAARLLGRTYRRTTQEVQQGTRNRKR